MSRRTVFVSDLHIGSGADTNWYQKSVHEPLLKNFLRYLQACENSIEELVILGDWFDLWNYHPFSSPPDVQQIMRQNPGVFTRQPDGDFITLMDKMRVRYINGDHDMEVQLKDINRELSQHTFQRLLPGHGTDCEKEALANTYFMNGPIWAEHGHQHDLFNKPAISDVNPLSPLPLGYFVARIYCHFLEKKIASTHRRDAACVVGGGNSGYDSFGIRLSDLVTGMLRQLKNGEKLNPAQMVLDMMMRNNRSNLLDFRIDGRKLREVSIDGIARFYPDLVSEETFYEALCEAEVAFDGLSHFARAHFAENPHTRVIVMGHTHCVKTLYCGNARNLVFANSGYFCPSKPDMKDGRALPAFVEVETLADGSLKVYQKAVGGVFPEDIRETACFRVN
jgi:UDP-2,3-diacylglucosamine pyrophosphatase LpxH